MNRQRGGAKTGALITLLVVMVLLGLAWTKRLEIYDWLRLRDYTPPPAIAQLASATTMNDRGKHLFYVNHPELSDRSNFSAVCSNNGEKTIVLGCYITGQGIYIFDVNDERLAGVEEVTSAHEMLHSAYERLSDSERARIDKLTQQAYAGITSERLRANVKSYRSKDTAVVPNELHSILGTEVRNLPVELEQYYNKYFTNRLIVVGYAERYEQAFAEREAKAESLEKQITAVRSQIESREAELRAEKANLEADRSTITNNQQVTAFNARVSNYNGSIAYLNSLIDQHNNLVEQYKQVVLEENELIKALDSRPSTL